MATFEHSDLIEVVAWGRTVGAVAPDDTTGAYVFEYDPDWIAGPVELAPIHMPNRPGTWTWPRLSRDTFWGLPPLLADSLPDRFGNALIDSWMAARGVDPRDVTALDRLAYTGSRAMGALEYREPIDTGPSTAVPVALADLVTTARAALRGELSDDATTNDALGQLVSVGTSAGGARAKAVIAYNPDTHQIRSGQFDAPDGYEHWLVKFDGVDDDPTREATFGDGQGYGRIEYAYHLMATAAGIEMTDCRLLPEGPRTHFLTRRFDRPDATGRHHVSTLCALDHLDFNLAGAHGYEQWFAVIHDLGLGDDALAEAFRRTVFNVVAVNRDDHTKNISFLCDRSGTWSLAPAYDLTYAYNPTGRWTSTHQMTVGGKNAGIGREDLERLADRFEVPGYRGIIDTVSAAVADWRDFADTAGVPADTATAISRSHAELGRLD